MRLITISLLVVMAGIGKAAEPTNLISFKKGSCMGKCPVYSITIDQSGLLTYHGILNVDNIGTWTRKLDAKELRKLKRKLRRTRFHKLENEYGMNLMDAPQTTFTYETKDIQYLIKAKMDMPKKLVKLESFLKVFRKTEHNTSLTWVEKVDEKADSGRKESLIPNIIVQFAPEVNKDSWTLNYRAYKVKIIRRIAPNRELFLVGYDEGSIKMDQLIEKFTNDALIISAEANKKVKMR